MATHFNAFISYRHSPVDSEVAQRIHRQLERFRIPKAIQKATGIRKIDRIFRDKEELPLSVNLSDDINEALVNSDFLIVICSPRFQQSQWCMREIELFLQTHPVERVLIVLAEGEPDDVVPPILTQNREPLCCDFRMKPRQAKNIELPRLVSAILGCRYDELRQRQRQYRMRRTIAAFSAALVASLCLSVYFIHTSIRIQKANDDLSAANVQIRKANVQIQSNLDQALRNQSEYLASAAQTNLDEGDRLTAIALALEALPDDTDNRPYVAAAEYALSDALSAYRSTETVTAQGTYTADTLVDEFVLSEDGSRIYVRDARNVVTVWDTATFRKLHTIDATMYDVQEIYLTPKGNVILFNDLLESKVVCVDVYGQQLWWEADVQAVAFLDDRSTVILMCRGLDFERRLLFLDPDTGTQVREPIILKQTENKAYAGKFLTQEYQTGQPIVLEYYQGDIYHVALLDMETQRIQFVKQIDTSFDGANQWIDGAGIVQDGNVVVMCGGDSGIYNGRYGTTEVTGEDRADIWCFDSKTGRQLWQSELVTYVYASTSTVAPIPDSDWVLLQNGNTFQVRHSRTGELVAQCQSVMLPLFVNVGSKTATGILENGDSFIFNYAKDLCTSESFLDGTVDMAQIKDGYFIHTPLSNHITVYRESKDDRGVRLDTELAYSTRFHQTSGNSLAIKTYYDLFMIDTRQQNLRWRCEAKSEWTALGFGPDGSEFWMWNQNDKYAAAFSVADGTQRELPLPAALGDQYTKPVSNMFMAEDQFVYVLESVYEMHLLQVDMQTGNTLQDISLETLRSEDAVFTEHVKILLATESYAWLYLNEDALCVVDLQTGNVKQLAEGITQTPVVAFSKDFNQVLVGIDHELRMTTPGGALIRRIDLGGRKAISQYFYGQQLLVLCDDGTLQRYDRTGNHLSQTILHIFDTFASNVSSGLEDASNLAWWVAEDGDLIVNAYRAGNIVDCENWHVRAFVPYLTTYAAGNDTLLCLSDQYLYAYPRYSTQQLMSKGMETLGDFRLSEEQRAYYGLNEKE